MLNRVLLIDDSLTIHKIVELTMSRQLFELVTARTPEEGLQVALEQSPSIILIDSKLAEYAPTFMDQLYTVTGAGIVLLVSSAEKPNAEYLKQMHAVSSLVKPFNASALNAALESALQSTLEEPTLEEATASAVEPETLPLVSGAPVTEKEPLMESLEKNIEDEIMAAFEPLSTPVMAVQEMEVAPMEEPVAIPVEQKPVAMPEPAAEIAPEPEPVAAMPVPEPIPAVKEPEATEMPSTPAMIVTDKPMPTLYVEPAEAPTDETPWEEILPPAADPTYAQSVQNTEVITSPGYKYDWLFADEETRAKMSTPDPSSPEERMAELDKILAEEIDEFTADFNEAYAKDDEDFVPAVEDALPVMTAEDAIEHVDQLFAETALDDDAPGVVIQEEEGDEMLQNESEEGLFGDVSYQDERELLSDLYSLLGEEQEIDEHMDVIEDAGELEDATSVLRQEIEERHELMGMFDDMNQEIEDLATRLEEGSTAAPVYRDTPEEPARTVDGNAGKIRDAREEDRSISPRAGQLIIELSKEDLAKIIQSSINTSMLEGLVKDAVQASLEKIVPALTEKIVREELRLIGDR